MFGTGTETSTANTVQKCGEFAHSPQQYCLMGPRPTRNNAVLDLPSSVELISTLEGMHFGNNREVTQCIEHIQCISTGQRQRSRCNAPVDHLLVHFWCDKANFYPATSITLLVPKWWTAQMFLGVLYASIESKKKIYIFEFKCPSLYNAEIVMINNIAIKYFKFRSESSLCANSLVTVGLCLVHGGSRKVRKLIK